MSPGPPIGERLLLVAEDQRRIEALLALYGHVCDDPTPDGIRSVFSEDAVFDATAVDAGRYEGATAIYDFFALGKPPHPPSHHGSNSYVFEADGVVRALSKFMVADRSDGTVWTGDYRDMLEHGENGWRITERIVVGRFPERT